MSPERTFPPYRPGQRRAAPDLQTRRVLFVASIISTVLVGGIAGTLLFGGQGKTRVPVVEASERPIRVRPDDPGGMQVSGLSESAFDGTDSDRDALRANDSETLRGGRLDRDTVSVSISGASAG